MSVTVDNVLAALSALHAPEEASRRGAIAFLEQLKRSDAHGLLAVSGQLTMHQAEEVVLAGFSLLTELVKGRWAELTEDEKSQVTQLAFKDVAEVCATGKATWAIKTKVAVLLVAVVRQQGAGAYTALVPQLLSNADTHTLQAELACMVLSYLSEDLTTFDTVANETKRVFLQVLTSSVPDVFPFLCRQLERQYGAMADARAKGKTEEAASHAGVVSGALSALSTWVEWTPMSALAASSVLDACTFFMGAPEFRLPALHVLRQVVARRRTSEKMEDYDALMDKAASLLVAGCQKLGLLQPGGFLPAALLEQLDAEGELEEFGQRLTGVLATLGEMHYRCLAKSGDRCNLYLTQMLALTRHPSVHLSSLCLPLWAALLRDALPHPHAGGSAMGPAKAAADAAAAGGGGAAAAPKVPNITLPPECLTALMTAMGEQLPRVVLPADATDVPLAFDSHAEYKEFCSQYKGLAKQLARMSAHLVPEHALSTVSELLSSALSCAPPGSPPAAVARAAVALEAAVVMTEAVCPPLIELAARNAGAQAGLVSLFQSLLSVKVAEPLTTLLSRVYEAFSKLPVQRPDLAAPLVTAAVQVMLSIPLSQPGALPPPRTLNSTWRRQFEGRLNMCSAVVAVARDAPAAFAPLLEPLVAEVQSLWSRGLLQEGEKVLLFEGMLAASRAGGPEMQSQVLGFILGPVAQAWADPGFRASLASMPAFVARFMPIETGADGVVAIGGRAERWALYHQTTLVERAFRRTLAAPAADDDAATGAAASSSGGNPPTSPSGGATRARTPSASGNGAGSGSEPDRPAGAHVSWALPVLAQLLQCLHRLWSPEVRAQLGALRPVTDMDPVERAVRLGEDRNVVKDRDDPRCVAGASVSDARYFVRGIRETSTMALSLAAAGCGRALWANASLALLLVPVMSADVGSLDYTQLRLLHRHVYAAWAAHCPPEWQATWVLPVCAALLPCMAARLSADWAANTTGAGATDAAVVAAGGAGSDGGGGGGATKGRSEDEVLADSLLREVTREHMALLLQLSRPPGLPDPSSLKGAAAARAMTTAGAAQVHAQVAAATAAAGGEEGAVLATLVRCHPQAAGAAMRTALMGLCWPDSDSAGKATGVCRYFVLLAMREPRLEPFVCVDMLKTAFVSMTQVFTLDIQAEVLRLLHTIITTFLSRAPAVRDSMRQLLQLPDEVLAQFERQLRETGSEKEQRSLIRQLAAYAGNDDVKRILSSVGKCVPLKVVDAKPKAPRHVDSDTDALLGGAIFSMIFGG